MPRSTGRVNDRTDNRFTPALGAGGALAQNTMIALSGLAGSGHP
jgi:hypothetical protein